MARRMANLEAFAIRETSDSRLGWRGNPPLFPSSPYPSTTSVGAPHEPDAAAQSSSGRARNGLPDAQSEGLCVPDKTVVGRRSLPNLGAPGGPPVRRRGPVAFESHARGRLSPDEMRATGICQAIGQELVRGSFPSEKPSDLTSLTKIWVARTYRKGLAPEICICGVSRRQTALACQFVSGSW